MRSMPLLPHPGTKTRTRRRASYGDRPSPAYVFGMVAVGISSVLLPLGYAALCAAVLWTLGRHAVENFGWLAGPEASLLSGAAYAGVAGGLSLFSAFLLRPLWSDGGRQPIDLPLPPDREVRLYAFVGRICDSLGAPEPLRILVNMDVNACARFTRGWGIVRRRRLELVLGLPLVRGLELGQFAAVLAHELGHFRQGAAMRLVHAIRASNQWFAQAARREADWSEACRKAADRVDPFLAGFCWCAWISAVGARAVLRAHAWAGQAASCVLLREMEHAADRAAVRIVGGETFSAMVLEAKVIEAAWGLANRSLGLAMREGNLADDLPALVAAHTRVFIPEVRRKMERGLTAERASWFDTHPGLGERIRRARHAPASGRFRASGAAHTLFSDFAGLARRATLDFYQRDLGNDFNPNRMLPTGDLVAGQSEIQAGEAAVAGYFLGLLTNLRPIWLAPRDLDASGAGEGESRTEYFRRSLRTARERLEACIAPARELSRDYAAADSRMLDAVQALALMRARFWIEPGDFQLRRGGAAQAGAAFREAEAEQRSLAMGLLDFEESMRRRMASALGLLDDPEVRAAMPDAAACAREAFRLFPALESLRRVQPRLESLRRSCHGLGVLLENLEGNEDAPEVDTQLRTYALAIRLELEAVGKGLAGAEYPFGAPPAGTDLKGYALDALPGERDYPGHHAAAEETLGRCYALYFRIFGRLSLTAGRVEGVLGLGPLRVGD